MNRKKRKISLVTILFFVIGLVLYLTGILLLFSSSLKKIAFFKNFFLKADLTEMKILGAILFIIGFIIFMIAVVLLYKNNNVSDNARNLIIEGKADVITLIIMTYIMIFMIVICLVYDEIIGALLFGVTIVLQTIINSILISYYSKLYKRK